MKKKRYRVTFRFDYEVEVESEEGSSDYEMESKAEDKAYKLFSADMEYPAACTEYDEVDVECLDDEG